MAHVLYIVMCYVIKWKTIVNAINTSNINSEIMLYRKQMIVIIGPTVFSVAIQ